MVMKIPPIDAGEYLRGLLLLIGKDRTITEVEKHLMKRIGKTLGFEREFCDNAIRDILENKYIVDTPPKFSTNELAMKFIKDGLVLAFSDDKLHTAEAEWLRSTAEKNGLDLEWLAKESERTTGRKDLDVRLEVDMLTVEYH
jgi:hypothetical protein